MIYLGDDVIFHAKVDFIVVNDFRWAYNYIDLKTNK